MLRQDIRPAAGDVERWTAALVEETRALLTTDSELQRRIEASPGLKWKALNVKKRAGLDK